MFDPHFPPPQTGTLEQMNLPEFFQQQLKLSDQEVLKQSPLATEESVYWTQCTSCNLLLYTWDLHQKFHVCPKCGSQFKLSN